MDGVLDGYLTGLPADVAEQVAAVNAPGLAALRRYLAAGDAVAFLGGAVSAPLYPSVGAVVAGLVEAAAERGLGPATAQTCRELAEERLEPVVEVLRGRLGAARFRDVLREVLGVRRDPVSGRTWTPAQELVCRCAFVGVVTTGFDPGIVDARVRVRRGASSTGFTSWTDELGLDRWRSGEVFADELPVLFAHGCCSRPDEVVLAATEYRQAYAGKLAGVLAQLLTVRHVVWVGFGFTDPAVGAVLREVAATTGTRLGPGQVPRHVAVMGWDRSFTR
jgi:hypothetical protein